MPLSRTRLAGGLAAITVAGLLGGWIATGWPSVRAEAERMRAAPRARAEAQVTQLSAAFSARLEALRAAEGERPYYHYGNLFHDPRGASEGLSVVPSPLARGPADPLVATHYQIDGSGELTIPTINDELPELSEPTDLAGNRALLAELREARAALGADVRVAAADLLPSDPAEQIQAIEPQVYAQNAAPNVIYQQVQQKRPTPGPQAPASAVEVVTTPLEWRTAQLDGGDRLVATRTVRTPDGALVQGLVIDTASATAWLRERANGALLASAAPSPAAVTAPVEASGGTWVVAIDPGTEVLAAASAARAHQRAFWWSVVPAAIAAIACAWFLVIMVARADRLARQRSQFAAAAAHELRTPLAGLQLYGDMLADGLGDPSKAQLYARRVADEAARLGRVVANVLGFTQLERGALTIELTDGDAADAAARAVDRMRPALEHAGVALELDAPEPVPARFDDDAVQRILQNLLDNAEKYTRDRPSRRVRVRVRAVAEVAEIEVHDDGPGVPARVRAALFRPFVRGADDDGPAGLGLGLALSRALAERQGGGLTHRDASPGASFILRLPT